MACTQWLLIQDTSSPKCSPIVGLQTQKLKYLKEKWLKLLSINQLIYPCSENMKDIPI